MLGSLAYLYVGSAAFEADVRFYRDILKGRLAWAFERFGARVAAFELSSGPLVLLADHRPAGEVRLLYRVENLESAESELRARGLEIEAKIEVPPGPCLLFRDPSGNRLGVIQEERPGAMAASYADPSNGHRIPLG